MKSFVLLIAILFSHGESAFSADVVRVACMGDSITAGARVDAATQSFPAQLQQMLGAGYEVKNFGLGGATMMRVGRPNAFQELPAAKAFLPQVVVFNFGINDTRNSDVKYWEHFAEFEGDAKTLLGELLALSSQPRILLCLPTANFADLPGMPAERKANVAERLPRLALVRAKLKEVAGVLDEGAMKGRVRVVDLEVPTRAKPEVFNVDGVHLKAEGYKLLAEVLKPEIERK